MFFLVTYEVYWKHNMIGASTEKNSDVFYGRPQSSCDDAYDQVGTRAEEAPKLQLKTYYQIHQIMTNTIQRKVEKLLTQPV